MRSLVALMVLLTLVGCAMRSSAPARATARFIDPATVEVVVVDRLPIDRAILVMPSAKVAAQSIETARWSLNGPAIAWFGIDKDSAAFVGFGPVLRPGTSQPRQAVSVARVAIPDVGAYWAAWQRSEIRITLGVRGSATRTLAVDAPNPR